MSLPGRMTDELVIALIGPVGAGVSTTAAIVRDQLKGKFHYTVEDIHVTEWIQKAARALGMPVNLVERMPRGERIVELQRLGTELRGHPDLPADYIARKLIEHIAAERERDGGFGTGAAEAMPIPRRVAWVIDSLKHPSEVELFRKVYGNAFWAIGVFAPDEQRKARLETSGDPIDGLIRETIMQTDEAEGVVHGQRVRDTIHLADFFIRNNRTRIDLEKSVSRYLELLFGTAVHTPTIDEVGMEKAMTAAASSACLSRQVGAAIYTKGGELIGVGANDAPKYKGGLYGEGTGPDHRCFRWGTDPICHNDATKKALYRAIHRELSDAKLLIDSKAAKKLKIASVAEAVEKAIERTEARDLIEFSRAVHAEMEAIVSVARGAKPGLLEATLYTTTFPCHSCARHIVAAGITRVYYTQPYVKSKAIKLHSDAISLNESDKDKVHFLQFEGVAPASYLKVFKVDGSRKSNGALDLPKPETAHPVYRASLDGFSWHESIVLGEVVKAEQKATLKAVPDGSGAGEASPTQLPI
jgi:deoxycytidylate deaminase